MARDLFLHAFDVCRTHRALYNARHHDEAAVAEAQAAVDAEYTAFDFPSIVRHLAWAEANLAEAEHARYGSLEERRQEVEIATSIRDKARALRDEIRDEVVNGTADTDNTRRDVAPDADAV